MKIYKFHRQFPNRSLGVLQSFPGSVKHHIAWQDTHLDIVILGAGDDQILADARVIHSQTHDWA